jgi:hypothetical protein
MLRIQMTELIELRNRRGRQLNEGEDEQGGNPAGRWYSLPQRSERLWSPPILLN